MSLKIKKRIETIVVALLACASVSLAARPGILLPKKNRPLGYWYVGAKGGVDKPLGDFSIVEEAKPKRVKWSNLKSLSLDVGGHIGYRLLRGLPLRFELAASYFMYRPNYYAQGPEDKVVVWMYNIMTNIYYQIGLPDNFSIDIGGGLGFTRIYYVDKATSQNRVGINGFAYQGLLGVDYQINKHWMLSVNYSLMRVSATSYVAPDLHRSSIDFSDSLFNSIYFSVDWLFD